MGRPRLAGLHGVCTSYEPAPGRTVHVGDDTVVAVLAALGVDASTPQAVRAALEAYDHGPARALLPPTVVVRPGRPLICTGCPKAPPCGSRPSRARCWTGGPIPEALRTGPAPEGRTVTWAASLGVHTLRAHTPDGRSARAHLVVAPDRMPAPPGRTHGFMVQLYSLLSGRSWGMGDLGDLADLAAWSGRALGTGFLQINPLHAAVPGAPTDPRRTAPPPAASPTPSTSESRTSPNSPASTAPPAAGSTRSSYAPRSCAKRCSTRTR